VLLDESLRLPIQKSYHSISGDEVRNCGVGQYGYFYVFGAKYKKMIDWDVRGKASIEQS